MKSVIEGIALPLPLANIDTDQVMPKQFLRIIDKAGLEQGLFYDMRFDGEGQPRPDSVFNQAAYGGARILVAGPNFGCGSSREHAVWGLQQYGFEVVIAASFGEIFYFNALNNRLLLIELPQEDVLKIQHDLRSAHHTQLSIDLASMRVKSHSHEARFSLSERHRRMFMENLDMIGTTLAQEAQIVAFATAHAMRFPWMQDVGAKVRAQSTEHTEQMAGTKPT